MKKSVFKNISISLACLLGVGGLVGAFSLGEEETTTNIAKADGAKALCLIPTIVGPFMGAFAAASTFKAFFNKKENKAE